MIIGSALLLGDNLGLQRDPRSDRARGVPSLCLLLACRDQVGLLAYSPLAQGYLTGKYQNGARPPGARTTLFDRGQRYEKPGVEAAIDKYLDLAREFSLDPAQMALAFVTSRSFVTSNIIGATTLEQLKTDIDSVHVKLAPDIEKRIDALHHERGNLAP